MIPAMTISRIPVSVAALALALSGCGQISAMFQRDATRDAQAETPAAETPVAAATPPAPPPGARTASALDTTTVAEKAAALAPPPAPAGERELGKVAVSLGNPTEPGFWLRSSLVTTAGPGRVATSAGGSLAVDLIPGEGAAQLSLAAFRALDLSLTDLPVVTVLAR